jgi:hypothetical protein
MAETKQEKCENVSRGKFCQVFSRFAKFEISNLALFLQACFAQVPIPSSKQN